MRLQRIAVSGAVLAALLSPGTGRATPHSVSVTMSNFRFCEATVPTPDPIGEQCLPTDSEHVVNIPAGVPVTVTFEYYDHLCDALPPCPGHNAYADDGSFKAGPAAGAHSDFSMVITLEAGKLVPFHCTFHGAFGMTAALKGA